MAEPTPYQKLAANLAYLRKRGASPERQKQEIEKFKQSQDAKTKAERALSGIEKVGATASKALSGLTYGTFDELASAVGGKEEQRILQSQLEEDNPTLAFTAELGGALATPGSFLKAAPRAASVARKVGTVLAEGALQGGASGLGNAEGNILDRADETLKGATLGSVAAGVVGGAGRAASKTIRNVADRFGVRAPSRLRTMEQMADRTPDESIARGRERLQANVERRLGDETMVADVLDEGEGALRHAGTSNKAVRKEIDADLRARSNRLSNLSEERFSEYTDTRPRSVERATDDMTAAARDKAKPFYDEAEGEALAFEDLPTAQTKEKRRMLEEAIAQDRIAPQIQRVLGYEQYRGFRPTDHVVMDRAYKDIGRKIRALEAKAKAKNISTDEMDQLDDMVIQRGRLRQAMVARSPSYEKALGEYADDMTVRDAYLLGAERTPADVIPSELKSLDAATSAGYREGKATTLRPQTSNADLGEYARFRDVLDVFKDPEKSAVFRATWGPDKYREYLKDLLSMAGLQRMRGGMNESTSIDKLVEQVEGDPGRVAALVRSLTTGNVPDLVMQMARPDKLIDNLRRSKSAQQNKEFLMQRGEDKVQKALDLVERLRREGKLPRSRNFRRPNPGYAPSRMAGSLSSG